MESKEKTIEEHKHASIDISYKERLMGKGLKISMLLVIKKEKTIQWISLTKP